MEGIPYSSAFVSCLRRSTILMWYKWHPKASGWLLTAALSTKERLSLLSSLLLYIFRYATRTWLLSSSPSRFLMLVQNLVSLLTEGLITTRFLTNSSPVLQARRLLPYSRRLRAGPSFGPHDSRPKLICCYFKIPTSSFLIAKPCFSKWSHSFIFSTN